MYDRGLNRDMSRRGSLRLPPLPKPLACRGQGIRGVRAEMNEAVVASDLENRMRHAMMGRRSDPEPTPPQGVSSSAPSRAPGSMAPMTVAVGTEMDGVEGVSVGRTPT